MFGGLEIAGQILAEEKEGKITIPVDIMAKHGAAITALTELMLKHRKELINLLKKTLFKDMRQNN